MVSILLNRIIESIYILRSGGVVNFVKRYIYFNNIWVIVEKDIGNFQLQAPQFSDKVRLIKITEDNFTKNMLSGNEYGQYFRVKSYLKKGYHGYMLTEDSDNLLGYIWYSLICAGRDNHPDVKYINFNDKEPSAYMFDMYLRKSERGKNYASFLFGSLLQLLKEKGISKAYGFYELKNIPALWVHRLLKWKEVDRLSVSQVIFYKIVKSVPIVLDRDKSL